MTLKHLLLISASLGHVFANYITTRPGENITLSWTMRSKVSIVDHFGIGDIETDHTGLFLLEDLPSVTVLNNTYADRVTYNGNVSQLGVGLFSFILRNVTVSDAGKYSCMKSVDIVENCGITLVVVRPPESRNISVYPDPPRTGQSFNLTCISRSRSVPSGHPLNMTYTWKRNTNTFKTDELNWIVRTATKADRGDNYACQANEEGVISGWSTTKEIDVQYGPTGVQIEPNTDSVVEGRVLTCSTDCNPVCDVTWSDRNGSELTKGYGQADINVTRSMSDISCTAVNIIGEVSEYFNGTVLCSPRLYPDNDKTLTLLDTSSSFTTWTFTVLSYPETSLGEVNFLTEDGNTSVNLHYSSKKIQDNLHQYNVDFPCGSQPGKYQFYFLHEENNTPIVLMLPEQECEADDGLVSVVAVAAVSVVIAILLVVAAVVVYRSKKNRVRDQGRHDRIFYNAEPRERDPIRDAYATVKKIPRNKPIACSNRMYRHDANAKEQWSLIGRQNNIRRGEGLNNCGERNVDGLIYADLDLAPPTLIRGRPVVKGKVEETVYGVIDFSQTPGPELPEKIWEKESP